MFVDKASVTLQAGNGGNGLVSFRRERYIARGGPDGGDGGNGGNIIFRASNNENTLADFRHNKLLQAGHGGAGGKRKRHGKNGADLVVNLPVGTVVSDENGAVLADLTDSAQAVIIASGGKGGYGNAHFTSSVRQAPRLAENGEPGDKLVVTLELKMIADVGLVGLPNAGKSTLLSVISNARPTIADYPFTTIVPNLGVADIHGRSLLIADIPGLIEGAHQGKGLGDEFLRHVERTSVLIHLIDIYGDDIVLDYQTVQSELAAYQPPLNKRPQVVALTKTEGLDKKTTADKLAELKKVVPRGTPTLAISAPAHEGLNDLLAAVLKKVDQQRKAAAKKAKPPVITIAPDPDTWQIAKAKNGFVVRGQKIERFATRTRFGETEAEERLRDILRKTGVIKELEKAGIKPGQTIQFGEPPTGRLEY